MAYFWFYPGKFMASNFMISGDIGALFSKLYARGLAGVQCG